jgi:hypothetical protein
MMVIHCRIMREFIRAMSNWQFNSRPLKVGNRPDFLACRWHATYCWKFFYEGYNFALDLILIEGLQRKLWGPKMARVPSLGISALPLRSPEIKCHLDVAFMEKHRLYYKRDDGGFPQVRAVVSLGSSSLPVARPSTKNAQTMH